MKKVIATVLILIAILCVVILSEENLMPIDKPEETSFGYSLYDKNKKNGVQMDEFVQNLDYDMQDCPITPGTNGKAKAFVLETISLPPAPR